VRIFASAGDTQVTKLNNRQEPTAIQFFPAGGAAGVAAMMIEFPFFRYSGWNLTA